MGKFRGARRLPGLLGVFALVSMSLAAVAIADNLIADGDGLVPVADNASLSFGTLSCNADTSKNVLLAVSRNGGAGGTNVFKNGSTVTVTSPSVTGTGAAAVTVTFPGGNTIALPSDWGAQANNTLSTSVTARVTIHPTTTGSGSPTINFNGSGVNSSDAAITRTDTINASWSVSSCAPSDTSPPTSLATAKNADNSDYTFGSWTKQNVTVTLSGQDNAGGSGLKEIRYTTDGTDPTTSNGTVYNNTPFTISTEGTTTVKWRAIDNAVPANLEAVHTDTVKIDKVAPQITCGSADSNWHASDVSIACTANDARSGVSPASDESFSLSTNVPAGTETANAQTGTKQVSDAAGNTATAGPIGGNKVDKKAPAVSCGSADSAWHANDVSIACTATDGGSGVDPAGDQSFSLSTNVAAGTETDDAQTNSKVVSDALGHTTTAGPIGGNKVDKKAPAVSCGSADNAWHANDVTIGCTATDGGSAWRSVERRELQPVDERVRRDRDQQRADEQQGRQ